MEYRITHHVLHFREPAGTSRGVYTERELWLVHLREDDREGVGECAPLPHLSCDDLPDYEARLHLFCQDLCRSGILDTEALRPYPSMLFGLECALEGVQDLNRSRQRSEALPTTEPSAFHLPINGLVWMGTVEEMTARAERKLAEGYRCIKLKIGAQDFDRELELLRRLRERRGPRELELRVDANGAFSPDEALYKLELLSQYALHSIEQPIRAGRWGDMAALCRESPLPIALDEELIGVNDPEQKRQLLRIVKPAWLVLKPSLHGGMAGCREWMALAEEEGIGTWLTSALESNIGLEAIARFCQQCYGPEVTMPQGLGTGQLYTDNFPSKLEVRNCCLWVGG